MQQDDIWISPSTGMTFIWIAALDLWVGRFSVTNKEYRQYSPAHDSTDYYGVTLNEDDQPVVMVTFEDAKAYADWLTVKDKPALDGRRYRLPSEPEWLVYAQCGDNRVYPWGNEWPPVSGKAGNYCDLPLSEAFPRFTPIVGYRDSHAVTAAEHAVWENPWGLRGIGGNVWEVCSKSPGINEYGALRGASWIDDYEPSLHCTSRYEDSNGTEHPRLCAGFRLVLAHS